MTKYQKIFIINCLQRLEFLLSNPSSIELAVKHFTKNNHQDPRFQSTQITDASSWLGIEKAIITSLISEATFQITCEMAANEELMKDLTVAKELFLKTIVPKITANTKPENRLNSVKEKCAEIIATLNKDSTQETPYTFFQMAVGVAVVVTAAAFALK